jgi:hypothetical protein
MNTDDLYIDLYDLGLTNEPSYDFRSGEMTKQERLITAELVEKGYTVPNRWYTGEGDSFGPLSRCLRVKTPDGKARILCYA